ncbi:MAG TPA: 3-deoxy-7-phosphoheptulonate synthase [Pyrinomonadaceae bacterium]|nr:3-deoxy-7-phosphoheptulonate synthase [Pyrinomonadaceae bacterium]
MIVSMSEMATAEEIERVVERIEELNYKAHVNRHERRTLIGVAGASGDVREADELRKTPGVEAVLRASQPFTLASVEVRRERTVVDVRGVSVGGPRAVVIAGPCSVESRAQLFETARAVKRAGASLLRGGAYKPRTSPYDFQGLGLEALRLLKEASEETGLPVVTEVMATEDVEAVAEHADVLQVGARNMQNFSLLKVLARTPRPVLLKRGPSATIKEWLLAAEYLLAGGNPDVILCERGIKTFETETRNTLDLAAVARVKELSHLPVVVDPSHGTGRRSLVPAASRAAVAVGADGLMIEVHPDPERALSDGPQSLTPEGFASLMQDLRAMRRDTACVEHTREEVGELP